jgi:hypothetical protein
MSIAGHGERKMSHARRNQHWTAHSRRVGEFAARSLEAWAVFGGVHRGAKAGAGTVATKSRAITDLVGRAYNENGGANWTEAADGLPPVLT